MQPHPRNWEHHLLQLCWLMDGDQVLTCGQPLGSHGRVTPSILFPNFGVFGRALNEDDELGDYLLDCGGDREWRRILQRLPCFWIFVWTVTSFTHRHAQPCLVVVSRCLFGGYEREVDSDGIGIHLFGSRNYITLGPKADKRP